MAQVKKFALVVIDMSQEQLYPDGKAILPLDWKGYENILSLGKLLPKERVIDSRLWIEESDHSTLAKLYDGKPRIRKMSVKLVGKANTEGAKLVSQLKDLNATFAKKIQYSTFFGSQLDSMLKSQNVTTILVTGINTDYCVFASSLDAFYLGYEVWLIEDACGSIGGPTGHQQGINEIEKFLVSTATVMTTGKAMELIRASASLPT